MTKAVSTRRHAVPARHAQRWAWAAYAACAWAVLFSVQSFYYAAGGMVGADTWPPAIVAPLRARDPLWVGILWGTGVAKVLSGIGALALIRPWGRRISRRLRLIAAWGTGVLLVLYGGASWVQHGVMLAGVLRIPAGLGAPSTRWHVGLWDPWWVLGGVLFCLAAWHLQHRARDQRVAPRSSLPVHDGA